MPKNMSKTKVPVKEQSPEIRNKNFEEVSAGYTKKQAIEEANRCLNCKDKPCTKGCPVRVRIPEFIEKITKEDFIGAYKIIKDTSSLPAVCGRVCPQETQCEKLCVRGKNGEPVAIGRLERFVADYCMNNCEEEVPEIKKNGKKVAVIGAGPAGLTCAGDLAKAGFSVTIFEAFHKAGGVLVYGIPEFRLPKSIVQKEIDGLKKLGVEIETNVVVGKTVSVDELKEEGFEAFFIGTGAGLPSFMSINGENYMGVYSANEFLTRINLMKGYKFPEYDTPVSIGKKVAVVGGGNVAMDAARCAKRLGAEEVYIIYRRSEEEMPARKEEVHHAKEEGIIFKMLTNPVEILGNEDGWVSGIRLVKMELGEPDASGRRKPYKKENSEYDIEVDNVIIAIGQTPNPLISNSTKDLATTSWGGIVADENGLTSIENVYAGGDAVSGAATVILAMGAGKTAAKAIIEKLK